MNNSTATSQRWLYGPGPDLWLGCGLGYALVFVALTAFGSQIQAVLPLAMMPILTLALSVPHYGSTLLRVYEQRSDREKYKVFSVYLTVLVWALFVAGVYSNTAGSMLITLYLMWSPWHYMGQNYGIALMFLGRRGVKINGHIKRLLHLSFLTSFLLALIEMQSLPSTGNHYRVMTLELPDTVRDFAFVITGTVYLYASVTAYGRLLKIATVKELLPTIMLTLTQALWFLVPLVAIRMNIFQESVSLSIDTAVYAFFWIAIGHAVQYLWITAYYARKDKRTALTSVFLGKALFAGAMIWVIPGLLFAPGALGRLPYDAGFALLIAAAVNVHHFILDGAIWKLKNGAIARILLRDVSTETGAGSSRSGAGLSAMRPVAGKLAFITVGLLCVGHNYYSSVATVALNRAWEQGDISQMSRSIRSLSWLGRDSATYDSRLGVLMAENGETGAAIMKGERAARLDPSQDTWGNLSVIYERAGNLGKSMLAAKQAVWLAPESGKLADRLQYLLHRGLVQDADSRQTALTVAGELLETFGHDNERLSAIAAGVLERQR